MASESANLDYLSLHPFVRSTVVEKVRGTLIGSALGDAVGLYTEFLSKQQATEAYDGQSISLIPPVTPFFGDGHRDKFVECFWTDDTDHSLLMILTYLHHDGQLKPIEFAKRLQSWCSQGLRVLDRLPLGLGRTVKTVTGDPLFTTDPFAVAKAKWLESGRNNAANGSLMRTHPLGIICVGKTREETFEIAMEMSLVSHFDPRCAVACCIVTGLIRGILRGEVLCETDVDAVIEAAYSFVEARPKTWDHPDPEFPDAQLLDREDFHRHIYAADLAALELDDRRKIGYVYKALGTAVVTLRRGIRGGNFKELIFELVMEGGDADTNACIAGAVLGSWTGFTDLPREWRDGLEHKEWMMGIVEKLCWTVGIVEGECKGSDDPDTAFDGGRGLFNEDQMRLREKTLVDHVYSKMLQRDMDRKAMEKKGKKWFNL
ncbi:ADP-ribosylglycohydrolase-domain-containing protein [Tricharina praecox]|uniref:ADP-ribosylglycohydrolase-domain-containing protein n=1 Tax=Tricharina praecox TaxID=43433 RepID=UPI00221EFFB4|nr:ADP-ribosylglycohydrolase-domain-containing protein [Tricharina praecox]KAI5857841.1 ADP-ribosylglycohydrolase-domain-containing protein [Tricharina praecox]